MNNNQKIKKCPKCGGEFEEGLTSDVSGQAMEPTMKPFWGTKIRTIVGGLENPHEVTTYRCKSCGYLESYAK